MTRWMIALMLSIFLTGNLLSQNIDTNLYNPEINAIGQVDRAILLAEKEGKHVLIQVGGNWCPWCIKLHNFIEQNHTLDSLIQADYILIHVNYSKENKNTEAMARLQYPQRFGFPVLIVLDTEGRRLHTQNTTYLEEGESYSLEKIVDFLKAWNNAAIDSATYLNK